MTAGMLTLRDLALGCWVVLRNAGLGHGGGLAGQFERREKSRAGCLIYNMRWLMVREPVHVQCCLVRTTSNVTTISYLTHNAKVLILLFPLVQCSILQAVTENPSAWLL